jgi:hypothetical protein
LAGDSNAGFLGRKTLSTRHYAQKEEEGYTEPSPYESQYDQPRNLMCIVNVVLAAFAASDLQLACWLKEDDRRNLCRYVE